MDDYDFQIRIWVLVTIAVIALIAAITIGYSINVTNFVKGNYCEANSVGSSQILWQKCK